MKTSVVDARRRKDRAQVLVNLRGPGRERIPPGRRTFNPLLVAGRNRNKLRRVLCAFKA